MTISDNYAPDVSDGNGVTTIFTGNWSPLVASNMRVYLETKSTGAQTLQTQGVDYTLTFSESGYSVTMASAPSSSYRVIRSREIAITQGQPYKTSQGFQGSNLESSLDKLTAAAQDIREELNRAIIYPLGEDGSFGRTLPSAASRANKIIAFDDDGDVIVSNNDLEDIEDSIDISEQNAAAALASATAAATSATAASNSAAAAAASAAEGLYNKTIDLTFSDSPYVPLASDEGALYKINTSGGNVVINFSTLATYAEDITFAFVKTTGDANTITINRGGSDTINGGTSSVASAQWVTYAFIGDTSSGTWVSTVQTSSLGDMAQQNSDNINVTGGTAALDTLSVDGKAISGTNTGDQFYYSHVAGCLITSLTGNSTTASFTLSAGQATDSTNAKLMAIASQEWKVSNGSAANGYQGGSTLPNSDTIHVFLINGSSGTATFAHNGLTPTLPSGYTYYRRVGSFNTNGSGAPLPFTSIEMGGGAVASFLTTQVQDIAITNLSTSRVAYALSVPLDIKVQPIFRHSTNTAGSLIILTCGDLETDVAPSNNSSAPQFDLYSDSFLVTANSLLITNTSGQIGARASTGSTSLYLTTRGWIDFRR